MMLSTVVRSHIPLPAGLAVFAAVDMVTVSGHGDLPIPQSAAMTKPHCPAKREFRLSATKKLLFRDEGFAAHVSVCNAVQWIPKL